MTITTTDTTGTDAGIGSDIAGEPAAGIRIAQVPAPVAVDLYRDIHKGIRAELFDLVLTAGSADPGDEAGRSALADHIADVMDLLVDHAHHEDAAIQPTIAEVLPEFAAQVAGEHEDLEERIRGLREQARFLTVAADPRRALHIAHLDLAAFTADYLAHQDLEERMIMPALEAAIGVPAVLHIHQAIVGPMPPEDLARSLMVMLPAMNADDRVEMLGGIRDSSPQEVFEGVLDLAAGVLDPASNTQLSERLGL
jgi:hypothetical protein